MELQYWKYLSPPITVYLDFEKLSCGDWVQLATSERARRRLQSNEVDLAKPTSAHCLTDAFSRIMSVSNITHL